MPADNPKTAQAERRAEIERAARECHPCTTGLHICGFNGDDHPITQRNFPITEAAARTSYAVAQRELIDPEGDSDLLVDLMVADDIVENFWMRRQLLDRLAALMSA